MFCSLSHCLAPTGAQSECVALLFCPLSRPHTPSFCFIHHQVLRIFCCAGRGAQGAESPGLLLEGVWLAAGQGQRVDFRSSEVLSQALGPGTSVSGWGQRHGKGGNLETGGKVGVGVG